MEYNEMLTEPLIEIARRAQLLTVLDWVDFEPEITAFAREIILEAAAVADRHRRYIVAQEIIDHFEIAS